MPSCREQMSMFIRIKDIINNAINNIPGQRATYTNTLVINNICTVDLG